MHSMISVPTRDNGTAALVVDDCFAQIEVKKINAGHFVLEEKSRRGQSLIE